MGTEEEIMEATFAALCEHGYADLTMQSIADEFAKSKSLLHYHYDSKEDLLVCFLEHLLERFLAEFEDAPDADPAAQLRRMADLVVRGPHDGQHRVHVALLSLRAQAPYDEAVREQLVRNDERIRERIADIVRRGVEQGRFHDVDPERFAATFRAAIEGAQSHEVALGDAAPTEAALAGIEARLVDPLVAET